MTQRAPRPFPEPDSLSLPLLDDAIEHRANGHRASGHRAAATPETETAPELAPEPKPRWRGWIHAATFPVAIAAGIVLISLGNGPVAKWAGAIYMLCSVVLFGVSALYHRFNWKPKTKQIFRRLDHANIFLLIAGTYTPIALLALPLTNENGGIGRGLILLILVWSSALLGIGFRVFWITAPRWLYVPLYLLLGWAAVVYLGDIARANVATLVLVIVGGMLYTAGSVVYGIKRPNPVPGVFGFHEIFHALTVLAFLCHWTAALLIAFDPVYLR